MKKFAAALMLFGIVSQMSFAAPLATNEAYVLNNGLEIWTNTADHLWLMGSLAIGDRVTLLGRTASFTRDGQPGEYASVRAPRGDQVWVKAQFLSAGSSLAVVKADRAAVYEPPDGTQGTGRYISNMTIVAVLTEKSPAGLVRVQGYDRIQEILLADPVYVRLDDLTTSEIDVRAAILQEAMKTYVQTIFMQALRVAAEGADAVGRKTEPVSLTFIVNDDNVNVRSAPDEKNGRVIDRLNRGARVRVTEKTTLTYTVAGNTAAWFHIKQPDGWMFGFFLGEAPGIWTLPSGVPTDQRIIAALARIDMHLLADFGFSAANWPDPDEAWLPLMDECFPASDLNASWAAMEKALNRRDVASAMRKAENIAAAAGRAGLGASATDIAGIIRQYAEQNGDIAASERMNALIQTLSGGLASSPEYPAEEVSKAFLAVKPGTLFVGGLEDVRVLGLPEIATRVANMLDILVPDMIGGPSLASCAVHLDRPPDHRILGFRAVLKDLRVDVAGISGFMTEEELEPAVRIVPYLNGAWGVARSIAHGECGNSVGYSTNYTKNSAGKAGGAPRPGASQ